MKSRRAKSEFRWRRFLVVFPLLLLAAIALYAIGIAVYFVVLDNRIARLEQRIRDMGQPVTLEELAATYPEIPDEENAALVYLEALALIEKLDPEFERGTDVLRLLDYAEPDGTLPEVVLSEVESYVNDLAPVYALLDSAVTKLHAQYAIDFSSGWGIGTLNRDFVRKMARMEILRTQLALAEGSVGQVVQSQKSMVSIAESLRMEPTVLSQLLRIAAFSMAVSSLEDSLTRSPLPDSGVRELMIWYMKEDDPDALIRALVGDFCARNARLRELALYESGDAIKTWLRNRRFSVDNRQRQLEGIEPLIGLADATWPERIGFWSRYKVEETDDVDVYDLAGQALSADTSAISAFARGAAQIELARTALATELYRSENDHLPDGLEALVPLYMPEIPEDPFDG